MGALGESTFVIVGAGGLGSPLALTLALAGAGRVVLVDDDTVDLSNLPRQILYRTSDVGRLKVAVAYEALRRRGIAPARVEAVKARFDETTARGLLHDASVVCDGSDDPATKFFVNDAARALGVPAVIAGVIRDRGNVFPVAPAAAGGACYRCLFEAPPEDGGPTCADAGVLGPRCGQVAAWQARVAIALATGADPEGLTNRVWIFDEASDAADTGAGAPRSIEVRRRADCPTCATSGAEDAA
jgi:adenylyltransferase/sulfurtransferase